MWFLELGIVGFRMVKKIRFGKYLQNLSLGNNSSWGTVTDELRSRKFLRDRVLSKAVRKCLRLVTPPHVSICVFLPYFYIFLSDISGVACDH